MSKLILTGLCAAVALGLTACGGREEANMEANADMNAEEMAPVDNMMADENVADMNASDMNMANDMGNAAEGNATGNAAVDNSTGY